MVKRRTGRVKSAFVAWLAPALLGTVSLAQAADVLVSDRLTHSVYRYSEEGEFLGVVLADPVNIDQPVGMALSPDLKHLYVSSAQNSRLIRYDYNYAAGTASNPSILAQGLTAGLAFPNAILFEPDGSKLYVSNLNGTGIAPFFPDGTKAGPNITGTVGSEPIFQMSGLAWSPAGDLLAGVFTNGAGTRGAVAKSNATLSSMSGFIGPAAAINGAAGLLVHGNHIYVSGMLAGNIRRYNAATGTADPTFGVPNLSFSQGLVMAPDGNSFLVGILGVSNGDGYIGHYDFNGQPVNGGVFASHGGGGFSEATVILVEPGLPGDFDSNRVVDAEDLAIWEAHYGEDAELGDADGDGDADGQDFLVWQRYYTAAPEIIAVPEPNVLCLTLAAVLSCIATSRTRRPSA